MTRTEKKHWSRHLATVLLVLALTAFMLMRGGCPQRTGGRHMPGAEADIEMIRVGGWPLYVEIFDTPPLHRKGLGERQELLPGHGILFVLESPGRPALFMKNTSIALSIAFIDDDHLITEIRDLTPLDVRQITPQSSVQYVLGVRQGFFEDHGHGPGTQVELPASLSP